MSNATWCPNCCTLSKTEPIHPILTSKEVAYCPYCGGSAKVVQRSQVWEFLGLHFNLPEFLVQEMFAAWSLSDNPSFESYVRSMCE